MKEMSASIQHELDATRTEMRRGILELPQEAAESTAQMRRVIVEQIDALAELNRIVARPRPRPGCRRAGAPRCCPRRPRAGGGERAPAAHGAGRRPPATARLRP